MKIFVVPASLAILFFTVTANAEGVSIEPGLWEMTTTMTMSMMPQPQTTTIEECIEETELDPEDFTMDEENPCDINDVEIDSDTASWSIVCPAGNGMEMAGSWEFTSHGDSLNGKGSMSADMAGQKMDFDMSWEGKRIGDCE